MKHAKGALLETVGRRLRAHRQKLGISQAELATRAQVSRRFLIQLEAGEGNATLMRVVDVCHALALPLEDLFRGVGPGHHENIALVGLRGAGKSSIGRALAERLDVEFVELDAQVESEARMTLAEIFEFRGPAFYRDVEARALERILTAPGSRIVAVGGSLVTSPSTWARLRELAMTVWLRASPRAHFERVTAQGDLRPMLGHPDALGEIRSILEQREPLYAMADVELDTDSLDIENIVETIASQRSAAVA